MYFHSNYCVCKNKRDFLQNKLADCLTYPTHNDSSEILNNTV